MSIHQKSKSLISRGNKLSDSFFQLEILNGRQAVRESIPAFQDALKTYGFSLLKSSGIEIFQVNTGKLCNQSCAHCHVDAAPDRREIMPRHLFEKCLAIITNTPSIKTVDITGGAPELNPNFRWFVEEVSKLGKRVIDRCNLTVMVSNPKYRDLPLFFATHKVNVVASLPYFTKLRTDAQRGDGVFEDSIEALKMLNAVGYGQPGSGLELDLVYNPTGAFLPGNQASLELEFKRHLHSRHGVVFNRLFTITNLPISRFLEYLLESGNYEDYMEKLVTAFNPATVPGLMCRNTISVSWEGYLYDCDFNQMLDLKVAPAHFCHLDDFDLNALNDRQIVINQHCYGCTAGAGSSCGGAVI